MSMNRRRFCLTILLMSGFALSPPAILPGVAAAAEVPLVAAARSVDVQGVQVLLERAADVQAAESDGMTALHWAVQRDAVEIVDLLLAAGADVSASNHYGVTPLTLASLNGGGEVVTQLLAAGADPNARLADGETVLMTAARTGEVDVIAALLAAGGDPNGYEQARGQTALMWAAAENNVEAIVALVAGGADIAVRTRDLSTEDARGTFSRQVGLMGEPRSGPSFTALLFAARELAGAMRHALAQADAFDQADRPALDLRVHDPRRIGQRRDQHVFQDGQLRQQVMELEHEPDPGRAQVGGQSRVLHACNATDLDRGHVTSPLRWSAAWPSGCAARVSSISRPSLSPGSGALMNVSPIKNAPYPA